MEKYDSGKEARDALQIKGPDNVDPLDPEDSSWSDARIRSEFDTLQLFENGIPQVRIPGRLGDTSSTPEPITEAYPEFGQGGAVQLHAGGKVLKYDNSEVLPEE
ncbi:hypothetical protein [Photobacterium sp. 1_MG-2023]|uniref:hypothetical protein n=1 Tax=Photobacterium sp. 1_MG-2023 TaxID=3062646 RepID=UPI0026E29510|nr:hypothetical protein [Photobacterium sp. 1_MG-2023]MDO6708832.1 hypothetical protein [Photobacterium sp. 1_MG-2023]